MATDPRVQQVVTLIKAGKQTEAQKAIAALIKEQPNNADLWYVAAGAANNKEKQIELLKRTLRINPQHTRARTALDRLEGEPEVDFGTSPAKPKRGRWGCILASVAVGIGVVTVALLIWSRVAVTADQVATSLASYNVSVKATSSEPIPAKVTVDQATQLAVQCFREMVSSDRQRKNYFDSEFEHFKDDNFYMIGALGVIYGDGVCTTSQVFQMNWSHYTQYKESNTEPLVDKGIAWTKFLEGWHSSIQNRIDETATFEAYKASLPTEIMATIEPPPTLMTLPTLTPRVPPPTRTARPTLTPLP